MKCSGAAGTERAAPEHNTGLRERCTNQRRIIPNASENRPRLFGGCFSPDGTTFFGPGGYGGDHVPRAPQFPEVTMSHGHRRFVLRLVRGVFFAALPVAC